MKKKNPLTRREALKLTAGTGLTLSLNPMSTFGKGGLPNDNPIVRENAKQGSREWQLTRVRYDSKLHRTPLIEGYCSKQSVQAGDKLDIMISTSPASSYKIDFYRTGYYSGTGGRLVHSLGPLPGKTQPTPSAGERNIHECEWEVSTSLVIPDDWVSGVYLGKLQTLPGSEDE